MGLIDARWGDWEMLCYLPPSERVQVNSETKFTNFILCISERAFSTTNTKSPSWLGPATQRLPGMPFIYLLLRVWRLILIPAYKITLPDCFPILSSQSTLLFTFLHDPLGFERFYLCRNCIYKLIINFPFLFSLRNSAAQFLIRKWQTVPQVLIYFQPRDSVFSLSRVKQMTVPGLFETAEVVPEDLRGPRLRVPLGCTLGPTGELERTGAQAPFQTN